MNELFLSWEFILSSFSVIFFIILSYKNRKKDEILDIKRVLIFYILLFLLFKFIHSIYVILGGMI